MRLPIFRRGDFRQPPPLRNNLFYHFEHKIIDINVKKICGSAERPGRHLPFFRPAVRAPKPSSLVFRTGGREPCRRPGRHRLFSGPQFALRNRVHWLCGQAGANPSAGRAGFFLFSGPRFALQNRVHWFCGLAGANRAGGPGTNKKGACAGASSPHLKIPIKYPHSITCFWISG